MAARGETSGGARVTVLGSGDAFNSGARFSAAYLVQAPGCTFLLDCGPSTLLALKRQGIDPAVIDFVILSHLHGDHFAGVPFLLLEYLYENPRSRPLLIAGPADVENRVRLLFAACYKELSTRRPPFDLEFRELVPDTQVGIGGAKVLPFQVPHQKEDLSLGLKTEIAGKKILYSGDSAWSERFVELSRGVDLFLCECTYYRKAVGFHIDFTELKKQLGRLGAARLLLIHLGSEMLPWAGKVPVECAVDGMVIEV